MERHEPLVSVIIPVYNVELYLRDCLDNIINQTLEDIEIICVNDGSTDSCLDILNEYAELDSRITVITQKNQGLGAARNTGLENAHGTYLNFLDSDDYLSLDTLEKLYNNAVANDSDMVLFKLARFNKDEVIYDYPGFRLDEKFTDVDFDNFSFNYTDIREYVLKGIFSACVKLYRREILNDPDIRFPEGLIYEDVPFHVKAMLTAERLSFVPEFFYHYRTNEKSITKSTNRSYEIYDIVHIVEDFLEDNDYYDEFKDEFIAFKITEFNRYILFAKSEDFFNKCKDEFHKMEDVNEEIIAQKYLDRYHLVLDSDSYVEFLVRYHDFREKKLDMKYQDMHTKNEKNKAKNRRLNEKNQKLKEKNQKLKDKNANLKEKNQNLKEKNQNLKDKNKKLKEKNKNLKEFNESILNSTSWKITKPLRDIHNKF